MTGQRGEDVQYPAPKVCTYCKGGTKPPPSSDGRTTCGFCENGKPLDTQADWDASWGRVFRRMAEPVDIGRSNDA